MTDMIRWAKPISAIAARSVRLKLGMTKEQLAAHIGVNWANILQWEMGRVPISEVKHQEFYRQLINLSDHLLARRAKPDWTL